MTSMGVAGGENDEDDGGVLMANTGRSRDSATANDSDEAGGLPRSSGDDDGDNDPTTSIANMVGVEVVDRPSFLRHAEAAAEFKEKAVGKPMVTLFRDHFTLTTPSSIIRYRERNSAARVVEGAAGGGSQFILEEAYNDSLKQHEVSIRQISDGTQGVSFLRITYAIFTAFWTGFLFIFCLQVLLFLVLDLAIDLGTTSSQEAQPRQAVGVLLSFPSFVYGLASALVLAGAYIVDTWQGHPLIRNFTFRKLKPAITEWIFFAFFLGFPLVVMGVSLLSRSDIWWQITCLFWFSAIVAFYLLFTVNVIFYEMRACVEVTNNRYFNKKNSILSSSHLNNHEVRSWLDVVRRSILLRQVSTYSGTRQVLYLSRGSIKSSEMTDDIAQENVIEETRKDKQTWRTNFTLFLARRSPLLYVSLEDKPVRIYSIDDARDVRPYVTTHTWGLERIFCRPAQSRYIAILKGPGALTPDQIKSSLVCGMIGHALIFFIVLSTLVYLQMGAIFTWLLVIAAALVFYPIMRSNFQVYQTSKHLVLESSGDEEMEGEGDDLHVVSDAIYLVQETHRISQPSHALCWFMFVFEVAAFFIWPLIGLLAIKNYPMAALFFLVTVLTGMRYYINAAIVLEETGHMDLVDGVTEEELWNNQSRLNKIIGEITRGRSRGAWISVLGVLALGFVALMLGAVGTNQATAETFDTPFTYVNEYYYEQTDPLRYASCRLTSDLGDNPLSAMADYAYLAGLAYRGVNVTQRELDGWFHGNAQDHPEIVDQYRQTNDVQSAVSFKLVTIPTSNGTNFAYVLIRGTTNNWDMLTDAQLWAPAFLFQSLREILPLGTMFTPIMGQLIKAISGLESKTLDRVSFYKDTSAFVTTMKLLVNTTFAGVAVTGHSLGGGLALITGAQTDTPAVALSGPNTMLTRRSLQPPVTADSLNRNTFNIIPSRDIVPKIDDRAQNYQIIRCQAEFSDVLGCHDSTRSLCEILYTCGSTDRPVLCECVTQYGFPDPLPHDGVTTSFAELCGLKG